MFYPLYPVGIGAEWWLLYRAVEPAGSINGLIPPFFYFCLALYIPGKCGNRDMLGCALVADLWRRFVYNVYVYDEAEKQDAQVCEEECLKSPSFFAFLESEMGSRAISHDASNRQYASWLNAGTCPRNFCTRYQYKGDACIPNQNIEKRHLSFSPFTYASHDYE